MNVETTQQTNKRGVVATAISLSLLLTACGGGGSTPPVPGVTATPSTLIIAEDTGTAFEVVLNTEPSDDVIISVASADLSEATTSVSDLTFTDSAGATPWDVPQTVIVSGVIDLTPDGNQNINVVLSATSNTDTDYNALAPTNVATTVSDIDTAGFTVSATTLSTSEIGTSDGYTIVLNTQPDGDVVIDLSSADTNEGLVAPATLTFTARNWNAVQTVFVTPVDDLLIDGNQTYNIVMAVDASATVDTTGYALLTLDPVAVTNADNDTAGFTVSETTLNTTENGTSVNYTVVLNTMPDGDVVVGVASTDPGEGVADTISLPFNTVNWATPQTVTVTPVDDSIIDGSQLYHIAMTINSVLTSDSTGYAALTLAAVTVTNADEDTTEGTLLSPVVLAFGTDLPHSGTVDATYSYYEVTGVTAGTTYDVSITGVSEDADLFVYEDSGYLASLCFSESIGEDFCTAVATGASLWIKVSGIWTGAGATFTLDVQ